MVRTSRGRDVRLRPGSCPDWIRLVDDWWRRCRPGCGANCISIESPSIIGRIHVVAIGTSLPELAVAIEAVAQNEPDIAVGGVLGSNVANVMLVLGTACMLGSGDEAGAGIRRDSVAVILATVLLTAFVYYGSIPLEGGAFMLILLVGYYAYAYVSSKGKADAEEPEELGFLTIYYWLYSQQSRGSNDLERGYFPA